MLNWMMKDKIMKVLIFLFLLQVLILLVQISCSDVYKCSCSGSYINRSCIYITRSCIYITRSCIYITDHKALI